ncbi:hypothetical protein LNP17_03545 [Klebsiella variicola subsp. variicola]|nr:hypothetical protein [Klebsiella variicola subsp. variicola]
MYREFRQITDSTLTQSSVLGVLNETLPAEAVIVAAAGSPARRSAARLAQPRGKTPTTWSTATPAWDTKSTRRWA